MLSASLHNVAAASSASSGNLPVSVARDRSDSYVSSLAHSVDRDNYVSVSHPLQAKSYLSQPRQMLNRTPGSVSTKVGINKNRPLECAYYVR